ncbi:hypothetical protein C4J81_17180 [Deltaproteobacteria bacterium Smac51]|nr:hypothetical protein C4J81_17180 [Deltaproteobacteria bacterium Smac51]
MSEVYFDYTLRSWQADALAALEKNRFGVIVAHRRAGKTEAVCLRLLMAAMEKDRVHPSPLFAYVAPFLNQAKAVAWDRLKFYSRPLTALPGFKINESELSITMWNGATIRIFGADYPDRLRGLGFDGVVMDEVAQMRPDTWSAVVRPALSDRLGWAVFIGTPKGQNLFYDLYHGARRGSLGDDWCAASFRADQTGVLPEDELVKTRTEMGEDLYRQEYLCDFTASNTNTFIDFISVQNASDRQAETCLDTAAPLVFGLDPARFGDDRTALLARRGRCVTLLETWRNQDLMYTASRTSELINRLKPQAVFVDVVGLGSGVVDRLIQLGHSVIGVNSGSRPRRPDKFVNLKAEMWSNMREWLQDIASIPDDQSLRTDLLAPMYDFDSSGRLKIESKDDLKKRGLPSPDLADALALTFAQPVGFIEIKAPVKAIQEINFW